MLRRLRRNKQKCVIKLNIRVAEFEAVKFGFMFTVGSAKKIAAASTFDNGLLQDAAMLQARQIEIAKSVFPENHCRHGTFIVLPIEFLETGAKMHG